MSMERQEGNAVEILRQHLKEFQIINRLTSALSSTTSIDDIYNVILCALVSPQGLDFTRSFLFLYNPKFDSFEGYAAFGPTNSEEACHFFEELKREEDALEDILEKVKNGGIVSEADVWETCRSGLQVSGVWISMIQKYRENELAEEVRRLSFSGYDQREEEHFLHKAIDVDSPKIHDQNLLEYKIPHGLAKLLDNRFVTVPIKGKNRRHAVVIVDRKFSENNIHENDLHHLQWFSVQASLAVENATLYNDLQIAVNDLKEIDSLKSSFLSTISHELRTPLTTINGFVDLLLEGKMGDISDHQSNLLSRVAKNGKHLINMVNDIIEVAEIQAHGVEDIIVQAVDPLPVLMSSINLVKQRKDEKNVSIEPEIEASIPKIISEEHCLERIFYHILDNAVKFSNENGIIRISFTEEAGEMRIAFQDEGIGMYPEQLKKIFDEFYQADSRLNRSFEGMGLGLTITRLLLTATGGKIFAESAPKEGSTFVVVFPIAS